MKNKGILAVIIFGLCGNITAMNKDKKSIRRSAERLLSGKRCSSPNKEQKKIIDTFLEYDDIEGEVLYPDDLSLVVDALNVGNSPQLKASQEMLHRANLLFFKVPGYISLLKRIARSDNEAHRRGAFFEIQLALDILNRDSGEEVVEFGRKIFKDNTQVTEVDLVTNRRAIECKSRSLESKDLSKLRTQLTTQKKCIQALNGTVEDDDALAYEVHFKLSVNEKFAQWLKRNDIQFVAPACSE